MGNAASRSLAVSNGAVSVSTPRGEKISSALPDLIAETALAREEAIAECYTAMAGLDTSEQLGPLLVLFLRLFPDTEGVEQLLTEGDEGVPTIASEAQLVELVNSIIHRLGAGPTGVRPARWGAPAQRGDALLKIQKAVHKLVARMAVIERFRFQLWDRLDGWEELELNQLGAFICECAKAPSPSGASHESSPTLACALLHPVAGCLTTPRSSCPRSMRPLTISARLAVRPAVQSHIDRPTPPRHPVLERHVSNLERCFRRGRRRCRRCSCRRTWCALQVCSRHLRMPARPPAAAEATWAARNRRGCLASPSSSSFCGRRSCCRACPTSTESD